MCVRKEKNLLRNCQIKKMDSLLAVEKEVEKAFDSFDSFYQGVDDEMDKLLDMVSKNMNDILRNENDQVINVNVIAYVQQCKEQIRDFVKKYSDKHKDLHGSISKIGKVIDKNFIPDFGNLPQHNIIDTNEKKLLLHQVICEHLYRNGHIDVSDCLIKEAELNEQEAEFKKKPFIKMNYILKKLKEKEVAPALEWCSQNAEKLRENNSFLEFNLHRLNFIKLIQQGSKKQIDALCYSRKFQPFGYKCSREIQKLMTSLLYVSTGLENSPYSAYLNSELWDDIEEEFIKNACKLMGLSIECPLNICIHAGCKALPALINIVQVMQQTQVGHILSKDELPIEIDIGPNCRYHSVFTCPILRQQSTDLNPPMKLICGHVISKDALNKLNSTGKYVNNKLLKCPYCPIEQTPSDAKHLLF